MPPILYKSWRWRRSGLLDGEDRGLGRQRVALVPRQVVALLDHVVADPPAARDELDLLLVADLIEVYRDLFLDLLLEKSCVDAR